MINIAISVNDLRVPPANRLEKLSGRRDGQYSIRINDQWRVCFEWKSGDAINVEITDYHYRVLHDYLNQYIDSYPINNENKFRDLCKQR